MPERIVDHSLVFYKDEQGQERIAMRGETVEVSGDELTRLEKAGALVKEPVDVPGPVTAPALPVAEAEAGQLLEPAKPARGAAKATSAENK